jgi:hypothetical protein
VRVPVTHTLKPVGDAGGTPYSSSNRDHFPFAGFALPSSLSNGVQCSPAYRCNMLQNHSPKAATLSLTGLTFLQRVLDLACQERRINQHSQTAATLIDLIG